MNEAKIENWKIRFFTPTKIKKSKNHTHMSKRALVLGGAGQLGRSVVSRFVKSGWKTISVETNDVVILPAWLDHMTQINDSEEDRFCISLNVKGFY